MKSVFLIAILAVAMIGVMVPSVFGQETPSWIKEEFPEQKIPTWVKDVAILWTDDEITNDEFLNTIKYLKESNIINIVLNTNITYNKSKGSPFEKLREYCGEILSIIFKSEFKPEYSHKIFNEE